MTKVCTKCHIEKPVEEFHKWASRPDGHRPDCKACVNARSLVWRGKNLERARATTAHWGKANREKAREAQRRYAELHPEKRRSDHLRRYGMTVSDYEQMFDEQEGLCAACGVAEGHIDYRSKRTAQLVVDHCHEGGGVRGLLCHNCNSALGMLGDSIERIACLLMYLERHGQDR